MSNQLSAKLTADVKGYKKAIEDAQKTLKVFSAEESATAQTMRKVYDVTQDQVKAYKKVVDSMSKATDGTKTMKQATNLLKNDIERLKMQWANLSETAKKSDFGKAMANSIRQAESQLKGMQSSISSVATNTSAFGGSMSSVIGIVGKFAPALAVGSTALKVIKDSFFNSEKNIDEWGRTVNAAKGTYQVFLNTLNNGDWSNFFKNASRAQQEMRNLYDLNDRLGSIQQNNTAKVAIQQSVVSSLRSQLAYDPNNKDLQKKLEDANSKLADVLREEADAAKEAGIASVKSTIAFGKEVGDEMRNSITMGLIEGGQQFMDDAEKELKSLEALTGKKRIITIETDEGDYDLEANELQWQTSKALTERYKALKSLLSDESKEARKAGLDLYAYSKQIETNIENATRKIASTVTRGDGGTKTPKAAKASAKLDEKWLNEDVYEALPAWIGKQTDEINKFKLDYNAAMMSVAHDNAMAQASTMEFLDTYNNADLTKSALSNIGSLNSGINSIYSTLESFGEMDNPFQVFDGLVGIAQNVMGVVDTISTLGKTMQTMSAVSAASAALEVSNSNRQTAANTGEAVSETLAQNAKLGPIIGTITGMAMVGTMLASLLASKSKVPKFADGGLVFGPTMTSYGLTGEYPGAKSNPEVIAPLSKLEGYLDKSGRGGGAWDTARVEIDGTKMYAVMKKVERINSRR